MTVWTKENPRPGSQVMRVCQWAKDEWSRFAQAAYRDGRNDVGHLFSTAASMPRDSELSIASYDALMRQYRSWLVFNRY